MRSLHATAVVCGCLALLGGAASVSQPPTFKEFTRRFGKQYGVQDFIQREKVYEENLKVIASLNREGKGQFWAEVNQFADWTPEEIKARRLARRAHPEFARQPVLPLAQGDAQGLPDTLDWRNSSVPCVTPVSDQGTVGSCWAFSTVENIEGQWALAGHGLTPLSAEYLVVRALFEGARNAALRHTPTSAPDTQDCDDRDCSVFGGWPYRAYGFIESVGGVPSAASHPYCAGTGACYPCMLNPNTTFCGPPPTYCNHTRSKLVCASHTPAATISGWHRIDANETAMKLALAQQGPLSVLMDATGLEWYGGGVWNPTGFLACSSQCDALDHAVLLVGYGTDAASGLPYWLVKNSWGAAWGEAGYFRLARGFNRCAIDCQVTTAVVPT